MIYYDTPAQQPQEKKPGLMEMMKEVRRIEKQIERLEDSIRRLDGRKYRCTSNVSDMPRGGQKADWYDIDAEIENLEHQIAELRRQHTKLISDMDRSEEADRLETDEYSVLKYIYISKLSIEATAAAMNMSSSTVCRRHRSALEKIDNGLKRFDIEVK